MCKNTEVFKQDSDNLWVVSRLFLFNDWKEIAKTLEDIFQLKVIINPLFAENVLIQIDHPMMEELIVFSGKWQEIGKFHLLFEKWNRYQHGRPLSLKVLEGGSRSKIFL